MNNQFDLNKFNSFLDKATQIISCDSDCQKQKMEQELKDKYVKAKENLTLAEPEFETSKKNYYTYVSGQSGYNQMLEDELTQKVDTIVNRFKQQYQEEIHKLKTHLNTYNGLHMNVKNIEDLHIKYKIENKQLYSQLKESTSDILTNERKTFYEEQQNDSLNSYYYYILWILYIIVALVFAGFSLFYPSHFSSKSKIALFVFLIIYPFISTWILRKIATIAHFFINILPKNVYLKN